MNVNIKHVTSGIVGCALLCSLELCGQNVEIKLALDTNQISVGQSTVLRVFAQVAPNLRASTDQIFSWYVDVLNTNGTVAAANYDAMIKAYSDSIPQLSSTGSADGSNRRGIYDTFLNLPAAGVSNQVELIAIPVSGLSAGKSRFLAASGTGVPALAADFILTPTGGGDPILGGANYSQAFADLEVVYSCSLDLRIETPDAARMRLSFTPCPGYNHTIQFQDALAPALAWQTLPGGPYNSGQVTITNSVPQRFFRIFAAPQ